MSRSRRTRRLQAATPPQPPAKLSKQLRAFFKKNKADDVQRLAWLQLKTEEGAAAESLYGHYIQILLPPITSPRHS